ncbi:MAG: SDR family oxidoreductase [Rhodospirillales bacterium]|jgi:NAD(P)-dependent dehydrogenase (short-subunit alcohol dehydrogenase family)|nr:SDR family oxidoreductase [Rhodospirillales bacterium]MDP6805122.1 SDR family oxidoreductase [Rhodospirillales bacterium]
MGTQLEGKRALVTGAGAGIGEAIARRFAGEGASVLLVDRACDACESVAGAIGGRAFTVDVSREDEVAQLFQACDEEGDGLDVLVNNAGIVPPRVDAEAMDMALWDAVQAVNVRGVILCTKYAIPLLKKRRGTIVNMASLSGLQGRRGHSPYSASKFAVRAITESVAQEVGGYGIRVNSLCPGTVGTASMHTRIATRAAKEGRDPDELLQTEFVGGAVLGRVIEPDEIADAALFLASDAAGAITGEHLRIDAGRR